MNRGQRLRVVIKGAVQGVGFRPFVYKLATSLQLSGWISNSSQGVFIEVEGDATLLGTFLLKLHTDKPAPAFIQSLESSYLELQGFTTFEIRKSVEQGEKSVLVLPDIATCPECLAEIFDPQNRRYLYPFTNCTLCGPRYTIIDSLPYDRPGTTMKGFLMCPECQMEYEDPENRRFHAQPNACPQCGPRVQLCNRNGTVLAEGVAAIRLMAEALRQGKVAAVKGLGGFHLMVDAGNQTAVAELRRRKHRNEKPLAVMMTGLEAIERECLVSALERRLLTSSEAPIVLLDRIPETESTAIAHNVAPNNPTLGIMLPYTPLHHILLREVGLPLVATSGNLSDEPICIDETDAFCRLKVIADLFLIHNRPILRHVDDSVTRVLAGREMVLRRARGYAPLPITVSHPGASALAVGPHQKNTVAFQIGTNVFISQHLGDLETEQSFKAFQESIASLKRLYEINPQSVICDLHPEYLSTQYAKDLGIPCHEIQHHHAHIAACMAENQLTGTVLGIAWDGTGAGWDGTIWGGEFLLGDQYQMKRIATFKKFRLPGSGQAIKEPRRSAFGLLYESFGSDLQKFDHLPPLQSFNKAEKQMLLRMLDSGFNSPYTSSVGRLFDAVSSLIGLRQIASFEGQGAMELEFLLAGIQCDETYRFEPGPEIDWTPIIEALLQDCSRGLNNGIISAKFHNTLVEIIISVAVATKCARVVLSGGCFQNRYLTERTIARLKREGFTPFWHQRVPPNDGGISLGQMYAGNRSCYP